VADELHAVPLAGPWFSRHQSVVSLLVFGFGLIVQADGGKWLNRLVTFRRGDPTSFESLIQFLLCFLNELLCVCGNFRWRCCSLMLTEPQVSWVGFPKPGSVTEFCSAVHGQLETQCLRGSDSAGSDGNGFEAFESADSRQRKSAEAIIESTANVFLWTGGAEESRYPNASRNRHRPDPS